MKHNSVFPRRICALNYFIYIFFFSFNKKKSEKFILVRRHKLSLKFGVNKCKILITNKSCPVMSIRLVFYYL